METREPQKSFLYDILLPKIEVISLLMSVVGFVTKWSLIKSGDYMLLIGLGTLSVVYFLRTYAPTVIDQENSLVQLSGKAVTAFAPTSAEPSFLVDILLPKIINLSSAITLIGIQFKLMSWSGSRIMLLVGVGALLTAVVLLALNQRMNLRALVLTLAGGVLFYVSADTLVRQFHRDDPVLVEKMIYRNHHPRDRAADEDVRQYLRQKRAQH